MAAKEINTLISSLSNLKGYYRFESGALPTDSSGQGNNLLVEAGAPNESASGKFGGCCLFDGNDCYKQLTASVFDPTGAFTIGLWYKISAAGDAGFFQSWSQNTNLAGIRLWRSSGNLILNSGRNQGTTEHTHWESVSVAEPNANNGLWKFLVATWDGSYLRLYLNGVQIGAVAWANAPGYAATNYRRFGSLNNAGTNIVFLTGSMDDLFFQNGTALSAEEILGIYKGWKKYNGLSNTLVKTINGLALASAEARAGL